MTVTVSDVEPAEDARLADMVNAVLNSSDQNNTLFEFVIQIEGEKNPKLVCALFESLVWQMDIKHYWVYNIAASCYRALQRQDAAFLLSAFADRISPDSRGGSYHVCKNMFSFFRSRGRPRDAINVFYSHVNRVPENPIASASELLSLAKQAGQDVAPLFGNAQNTADATQRQNKVVVAESIWHGWKPPIFGGARCICLEPLATLRTIPGISVAHLTNAELLISRHAIVVLDSNGGLHGDLSVHDFPTLLKQLFDGPLAEQGEVERLELDAAMVLADRFPATNLCHFLFDHLTRLHIYELAGAPIESVVAIDASDSAEFQGVALKSAGVKRFLSTDRVARVRVGALWVSSNCRDLRHPAHFGALWGIAYLRDRLGNRPVAQARRIYISRRDSATRRVINEDDVITLLKKYGFEIIVPSSLPYSEQIAIFAAATHVVGPHGAGLSNIVFCQPGAHVLELFHPLYGTAAYAVVAHGAELNYSALICQDGDSAAPEFNDPAQPNLSSTEYGNRNLAVNLAELQLWLQHSCRPQEFTR